MLKASDSALIFRRMIYEGRYRLDQNGEPIKASYREVAEPSEDRDMRIVDQTELDGCTVSTIFLYHDHSFGLGEPILWETMIFGGKFDGYQDRCSGGRDRAKAMHAKAVSLATDLTKTSASVTIEPSSH